MKWLYLLIGGSAGTFARYFVSSAVLHTAGTQFPYGTLIVNVLGCFFIGLLAVFVDDKMILGQEAKMLLMVGFCGAFTTFSTFMLETMALLRVGENLRAFLNVAGSLVAGFFAFKLGTSLGQLF